MQVIKHNSAMMAEYRMRWDEHEALFELYLGRLTQGVAEPFGLVYWLDLQEGENAKMRKASYSHR